VGGLDSVLAAATAYLLLIFWSINSNAVGQRAIAYPSLGQCRTAQAAVSTNRSAQDFGQFQATCVPCPRGVDPSSCMNESIGR
jgi:hypothetical protein